MKIGFIIPTTSANRNWNNISDIYLYSITLKSFLITYDKEHKYKFYIGIDLDDKIFNNKQIIANFKRFINIMQNVEIEFIHLKNIRKGHLTKMWNILFKKAYDEKCDYFYQCGDDIEFKTKGWINACIKTLSEKNDIGITSPIDTRNQLILTQSFVSRKHMDIFGFYFPEEIINWGCDDWINYVYRSEYFYPLLNYHCVNLGGECRYVVDDNDGFFSDYHKNVAELRKHVSDDVESKYKLILRDYLFRH